MTIERLCSTNSVQAQGYTDSQGRFSLNLGQNNNGVFNDASSSPFDGINLQNGIEFDVQQRRRPPPEARGTGTRILTGIASFALACLDIVPSTVSLAGRRSLDNPDVGVIVLYPIAGIQGLTASATSGQAPKDARKAYAKGLRAAKKNKPDQAEQEFRKAVQVYPKYAEAWLELGEVLERGEHYPEAREAYAQSLAADPKYVYPYQQLYQIALREQNWKDLADKTDQLLHLDPYEFPNAYYFNALAHLQLKEYDAADKSAQQAVEADLKQANPKTHYLLGAILVQKKDWTGAAESFRAYLKAAPNATDKAYVEKALGQIDQQIRLVQTASQNSTPQP